MSAITTEDMQEFLACFNRHDVPAIMAYFAEDGVFETPSGKEPVGTRVEGIPAIAAYFTKMFANVPDLHFGEDNHWLSEDGERGVSEWTISGTQPGGSAFTYRGCDHFLFRGGKIVRKDSYQKIVR